MADAQTKTNQQETPGSNFRTLLPLDMKIDFVGKRRAFLILSTILNIAAIVMFFVRPLNYGVDFTGGTAIRLRFVQPTTAAELRTELAELQLRDLTVQDFGEQGREFLLSLIHISEPTRPY